MYTLQKSAAKNTGKKKGRAWRKAQAEKKARADRAAANEQSARSRAGVFRTEGQEVMDDIRAASNDAEKYLKDKVDDHYLDKGKSNKSVFRYLKNPWVIGPAAVAATVAAGYGIHRSQENNKAAGLVLHNSDRTKIAVMSDEDMYRPAAERALKNVTDNIKTRHGYDYAAEAGMKPLGPNEIREPYSLDPKVKLKQEVAEASLTKLYARKAADFVTLRKLMEIKSKLDDAVFLSNDSEKRRREGRPTGEPKVDAARARREARFRATDALFDRSDRGGSGGSGGKTPGFLESSGKILKNPRFFIPAGLVAGAVTLDAISTHKKQKAIDAKGGKKRTKRIVKAASAGRAIGQVLIGGAVGGAAGQQFDAPFSGAMAGASAAAGIKMMGSKKMIKNVHYDDINPQDLEGLLRANRGEMPTKVHVKHIKKRQRKYYPM